jgi:hypothetical protein
MENQYVTSQESVQLQDSVFTDIKNENTADLLDLYGFLFVALVLILFISAGYIYYRCRH